MAMAMNKRGGKSSAQKRTAKGSTPAAKPAAARSKPPLASKPAGRK